MVFKGVLPFEKGTEKEDLFCNKLRIFHATMQEQGARVQDLDKILTRWSMAKDTIIIRKCVISDERKRKVFEEEICSAINNHLGDQYQLFNWILGYYFHIPNMDHHSGICSTILAEVFMESGIFVKNFPHANSFSAGNFDQKSFKLDFQEGIIFGSDLKLTGVLK